MRDGRKLVSGQRYWHGGVIKIVPQGKDAKMRFQALLQGDFGGSSAVKQQRRKLRDKQESKLEIQEVFKQSQQSKL